MRKITDFIVRGRYFFLALFILLAGVGLFLSTKVVINEDIMKYLPTHSETKIGKDIMEKEFEEQDSSILNVMFEGLSKKEKKKTLKQLEKIKGVASVSYQNTKEYNKGKYTLYVLNVSDYATSKTATNVYQFVNQHLKPVGMSGSIYDENKPILQLDVVVLAISCAMVILILLSDSYLEPWLYLISIGIAIFINKGSNIMFESVSSITNSIVAILQLALSMDYSIMLSNRYKQEKERHASKIEAMKEALYQSFKAISSSSVTTIVGLLALVFMSFTIGKDLGFVLAKGVLLSLASIFFCLPALLLIFDKLIAKTKKKAPHFDLTKLGNFIYKTRWVQAILLAFLFAFAYFLKGNVGILYTGSEQDKVGKVFPATNQIAIVYNNKYEELITDYCKKLEKDKKIDQVLCYSNTIHEKLAYNDLNQKFKDLGQDTQIEEYLIKLIYYNYYNQDANNKMTFNEFISFIKSDIYTNDNFRDSIDQDTKDNLDLLENFTSPSLMQQKRSTQEIAAILGMDEKDAENILIYYNSMHVETEMTMQEFVHFMLYDVANDEAYSSSLDGATLSKLKQLQQFADVNHINKKMDASELSSIFGIDQNLIEQLFLFYRTTVDSNTQLTLNEFANFALKMASEDAYKEMFDGVTKNKLTLLKMLSDDSIITNPKEVSEMEEVLTSLGLSLNQNDLLSLYIYDTGSSTDTLLTVDEIKTIVTMLSQIEPYNSYVNAGELQQLFSQLEPAKSYSASELSSYAPRYQMIISIIYGFQDYQTNKLKPISIKELINFLYNNQSNPLVSSSIPPLKNTLELAYLVVNHTTVKYSSNQISNIVQTDATKVNQIFGVYDYNHETTTMTPLEFANLICNNKDNALLKGKISNEEMRELSLVQEVMTSTLNGTKYTSSRLSALLNIDNNTMNLLFSLYHSKSIKSNQEISLYNYVDFIVKDVMNNKDYSENFDASKKEKLTTIHAIMNQSLNHEKYTATEAFASLNILSHHVDKSLVDLVYMYYGSRKEYDDTWKMTIEEFIQYLNSDILTDARFDDFISSSKRTTIIDAKKTVDKSKALIVSDRYSRVVLNTKYAAENEDTYQFIHSIQDEIGNKDDIYLVGNSPMAVEMSKTFDDELNRITLLTMLFIFVVVAFTFKDLIIPFVLVLIIQTAVYITMSAISLTGSSVYFISLLIVQAILMGATIDYAIVYTSYYREARQKVGIKEAIIQAYNGSIHTILSSSSILIIVTLIVANYASAIAAKICETISEGTFAAAILILFLLPGVLATTDKLICRKGYYQEKKKEK